MRDCGYRLDATWVSIAYKKCKIVNKTKLNLARFNTDYMWVWCRLHVGIAYKTCEFTSKQDKLEYATFNTD